MLVSMGHHSHLLDGFDSLSDFEHLELAAVLEMLRLVDTVGDHQLR